MIGRIAFAFFLIAGNAFPQKWPADAAIRTEPTAALKQRTVEFFRTCGGVEEQPAVTRYDFSYPVLGGTSKQARTISARIERRMMDEVLPDCREPAAPTKNPRGEGGSACEVSRITPAFLSLYCRSWANPLYPRSSGAFWYLNYDLTSGRELTPADVFRDIPALKEILRAKVVEQYATEANADERWVDDTVENLANDVGFTAATVEFVTVHAHEIFRVSLDYEELRVLRPRYWPP